MKPIFCIVGQTGAGKNYMLDLLLHNDELLNYGKLYNLIYSTTRAKREGEVNGKDYNFKDNTQYAHESASNCIVESRAYDTINNGRVYYYTTKEYYKPNPPIIYFYHLQSPNKKLLNIIMII